MEVGIPADEHVGPGIRGFGLDPRGHGPGLFDLQGDFRGDPRRLLEGGCQIGGRLLVQGSVHDDRFVDFFFLAFTVNVCNDECGKGNQQ